MQSSLSQKALLESVVLVVVVLQMVILTASSQPTSRDFEMTPENTASSVEEVGDIQPLSVRQFRFVMTRQLQDLQQAEADILHRLRVLEAEKIALSVSQRKRSRLYNVCVFNVVSCYRKRK